MRDAKNNKIGDRMSLLIDKETSQTAVNFKNLKLFEVSLLHK